MKVSPTGSPILSLLHTRLAANIVFASCFIAMIAISLPVVAQDTRAHAGAQVENCNDEPEKNSMADPLTARQQQEYYVSRRWGYEVRKRKRKHCIGYHAGEWIMIPPTILGYALQDYSGGSNTSPVFLEIVGAGLGMFALGAGIVYLGSRHEAHHPKKFMRI